ncbi:hypothetical protein KR038_002103 [Drosophila bunnanda]|nr:hypothetical protein KR038_002103 [Drosophila bunnanda]
MENSNNQMLPIHGTARIKVKEEPSCSTMANCETILIIKKEKPNDEELLQLAAKLQEQARQADPIEEQRNEEQLQPTPSAPDKRIDDRTIYGHFGWAELEPNQTVIPFFYRHMMKCCAESMLKMLLRKFPLHPDIAKCSANVRKYSIFETERRLLREISIKHCDGQFGYEFTKNEIVMTLKDAMDCYQFRAECYRMLTSNIGDSPQKKCGFIQLTGGSLIPYIVINGCPWLPLSYLLDVPEELRNKSQVVRGWDLAYLKFCCLVQGVSSDYLTGIDSIGVSSRDEIFFLLNESGDIEYYWPSSEVTSKFLAGYGTQGNLKQT